MDLESGSRRQHTSGVLWPRSRRGSSQSARTSQSHLGSKSGGLQIVDLLDMDTVRVDRRKPLWDIVDSGDCGLRSLASRICTGYGSACFCQVGTTSTNFENPLYREAQMRPMPQQSSASSLPGGEPTNENSGVETLIGYSLSKGDNWKKSRRQH